LAIWDFDLFHVKRSRSEHSHRAAMEGFSEQHLSPRLNEHRDRR
jgi:hypothetical protein